MKLEKLDHLVLTVKDIEATVIFYTNVLGMTKETFGDNRTALKFGQQKINLHQLGKEFEPKAMQPTAGSADLCFITTIPIEEVINYVKSNGIEILEGPVERTGANSKLMSIYIRDPDLNLIEIANEISGSFKMS